MAPPEAAMVQVIAADGTRIDNPQYPWPADADETLLVALRHMVLGRRLDSEAHSLQRQGELGLWPSSLGQEGAQIGAALALADQDMVFPSYREHVLGLARGFEPSNLLALFRGCELTDWDTERFHFGNYSIVIGSHTLHAVGYGMGLVLDGLVATGDPTVDTAVLVCFGDGSTSQGDVNESLVFAASATAPIVFFCQNNQWAISEPTSLQTTVPLYQRAAGFGIPGVRVDGNDVLAVRAVTSEALQRARSGGGPTFIEAYTYRMGAHTTSDDPTRYRPSELTEQWRLRDPIDRVKTYLSARGLLHPGWLADLDREAEALGESLRRTCRALPEPDLAHHFDAVYADMPPELAAQRADHLSWVAAGQEGR